MASTKTIVRERIRAFQAQGGLCFYCDEPMLPSGNGARLRAFQCTAEHCIARQDGGKHAGNIVAAHALCNHRRHQAKHVLDADKFRAKVRRRMAQGRWLDQTQRQRLQRATTDVWGDFCQADRTASRCSASAGGVSSNWLTFAFIEVGTWREHLSGGIRSHLLPD